MPDLCMFSQAAHHDRLFHRSGLLRGHRLQRSVLAQQTDYVLQSATSADQSAILLPVCCRGKIATRNRESHTSQRLYAYTCCKPTYVSLLMSAGLTEVTLS